MDCREEIVCHCVFVMSDYNLSVRVVDSKQIPQGTKR